MNIIKMFMNNVIILLLAVRICEDSDSMSLKEEQLSAIKAVYEGRA